MRATPASIDEQFVVTTRLEKGVLAETMARAGQALIGDTPPNGKRYWAARFWDRDSAERHPVLAGDFLSQKNTIARYLQTYAAGAHTSVEFACGTGEFTRLTALHTNVATMRTLDISARALEIARNRVDHPDLQLVQGDFWADNGLEPSDLVVCVDAIHHLGDIREVLTRLRTFVKPGGTFIGNVFTVDNFHEFERRRYGRLEHTWRTALFLGTAMAVKLSAGKLYTGSHRTQLKPGAYTVNLLGEIFDEVLEVTVDPYFTAFACRA
ncbi:MAG: class I SAM-dependent methyltransferase [Micromonosporaceae bacterium]|nr:class I SAM-dependent methyltransferase [Micromonosporaceae bacterium]